MAILLWNDLNKYLVLRDILILSDGENEVERENLENVILVEIFSWLVYYSHHWGKAKIFSELYSFA